MPFLKKVVCSLLTAGLHTVILSTIVAKSIYVFALQEVSQAQSGWWVPALFVPDLVMITFFAFARAVLVRCFRSSYPAYMSYFGGVLSPIFFMGVLAVAMVDSVSSSHYQMTGTSPNWQAVTAFANNLEATSSFLEANSAVFVTHMKLHGIFFVAAFGVDVIRANNLASTCIQAIQKGHRKNLACLSVTFLLASFWALAMVSSPQIHHWVTLSQPIPLAFATGALWEPSEEEVDFTDWLSAGSPMPSMSGCGTIGRMLQALESGKPVCAEMPEPDFSFLKRTPDSQIKHVILVSLESARSDKMPFSSVPLLSKIRRTPKFSKAVVLGDLTDQEKTELLTPYFAKLSKEGLFIPEARTTSTYTLKSLASTLAGVFPIPAHGFIEWNKTPYRPSLPLLLRPQGWNSIFLQAANLEFDRHGASLEGPYGFDGVYGAADIKKAFGPMSWIKWGFSSANYMGYDDLPLVRPLLSWIEANKKTNTPSFAALATNVNHHPWNSPAGWQTYHFPDTDDTTNKYLNTLRYTDRFVQELIERFRAKNLLNETLFVFFGDHGVSLKEHSLIGAAEDSFEETIKVPILFYTANQKWLEKHPPTTLRPAQHPVQNIDILPTLLDILDERNEAPRSIFDAHYFEGRSLVSPQSRVPSDRISWTTINPGGHAQVFLQNQDKVVFKSSIDAVYYDLAQDPLEKRPFRESELEGEKKKWFEKAAKLRLLMHHHLPLMWENGTATLKPTLRNGQ